jgi:hypothetical protein
MNDNEGPPTSRAFTWACAAVERHQAGAGWSVAEGHRNCGKEHPRTKLSLVAGISRFLEAIRRRHRYTSSGLHRH